MNVVAVGAVRADAVGGAAQPSPEALAVPDAGWRVEGLGFRDKGLGLRVEG